MAVNDIVMGAAGASGPATYVEDVFSTYLYTGNGSTQTITNGIDLSGKGGLVWMKERSTTGSHELVDTARGAGFELQTNNTSASSAKATGLTAFTSSGFSLGTDSGYNGSGITFASWTFREQPKFFDIVTWTGDASGNRTLSHTLASTPGCIIIKATNAVDDWYVYHRSLGTSNFIYLNTTGASSSSSVVTAVSSTTFTVSQSNGFNTNGRTYVAYLFAHDAGGFGATGTDNVISCGSFTTDGSGVASVTLGYEPQWILVKKTSAYGSWFLLDTMRGWVNDSAAGASGQDSYLLPNSTNAEGKYQFGEPNATGFRLKEDAGSDYIYIAIRRPMKTPTTGTSVYNAVTRTGTGAIATVSTTVLPDMVISTERPKNVANGSTGLQSRLTGAGYSLYTNATYAEMDQRASSVSAFNNASLTLTADSSGGVFNYNTASYVEWLFTRAAGFFDVVCYTGTGVARTISHNLGVAPELMIVKCRSTGGGWAVYNATIGNTKYLNVQSTAAASVYSGYWNNTSPTSSVFTVATDSDVNGSGVTYVAYLFATVAGVSKVFSFTGNGSSQTINCSFTTGARFILIKRTDSTGDWYVWDSARGIVSGNDPHLSLNTTAAEVTTDDSVDADSSGFIVNQVSATNVNVNGATYIGLAIA